MNQTRLDLLEAFRRTLTGAETTAIHRAVSLADQAGVALFLVGGPVRDLILHRAALDIDIAVEGDAESIAGRLAAEAGLRLVSHGRFGTATLKGPGLAIDFARTRREAYPRPGALPAVAPAGIEDDLARRDFTINSMALRLTPPAGELLDPHGGLRDIGAGLIRVLHPRSFQDDATRMLRACRYAVRLGFALEAGTDESLRRDLSYVESISGARLRRELSLTLREASAPDAALMAYRLGVLAAVHERLALTPRQAAAWRRALAGEHHAAIEELGWCMIAGVGGEADVEALTLRLHLTARQRAALLDLVRLKSLSDKLDRPALTSPEAVDLLEGLAPAAVWAFALKSAGRVRARCEAFLGKWRRVRPKLNGDDLRALGLASGPRMGAALRRLRDARLLEEVSGRDEEIALVQREFGLGGF